MTEVRLNLIPKGTHSSLQMPEFKHNVKFMSFSARLDQSNVFDLNNSDDQDVNKLFGLSFGLFPSFLPFPSLTGKGKYIIAPAHHVNSYRIGWNYLKGTNQFRLYHYWYNKGVRHFKYLCEVAVGKEFTINLSFHRGDNLIWCDLYIGKTKMVSEGVVFNFKDVSKFSYKLFPYFGGNNPAPHDMSFYIDNEIWRS